MKSKLQQYREAQHLTQQELAAKAGISVRTIQRIESGIDPKGYSLKALASALEIKTQELIESPGIERRDDFPLVKVINLSALVFLILPLGNIILPLLIMWRKDALTQMTKQIVSLQMLWTLVTALLLLISPFIQRVFTMGNALLLSMAALAVGANLYIIFRNAVALDRHRHLAIKLNFNLL